MANGRKVVLLGICLFSFFLGLPVSSATDSLVFTSAGKTAFVSSDGTGLRWLEFGVSNQAFWQVTGFFSDGQFLLLSMEPAAMDRDDLSTSITTKRRRIFGVTT